MSLIEALKLPLDERGQRRAAARAEWFAAHDKPLEVARHPRRLSRAARGHCASRRLSPPYGPARSIRAKTHSTMANDRR